MTLAALAIYTTQPEEHAELLAHQTSHFIAHRLVHVLHAPHNQSLKAISAQTAQLTVQPVQEIPIQANLYALIV